MAEYIEREKILDAISEQRRFYLHERDGETDMEKLYLLWGSDNALTTMEDIMSDIPAADVAPVVHGTWTDIGMNYKRCSKCGEAYNDIFCNPMNYCPSCGALMDGHTTPAYRMAARLKARFPNDSRNH